jgi:hypothetical protein
LGTGDVWTGVLPTQIPGNWGFNTYRVMPAPSATYTIRLRMDANNVAAAEYRARVVVHNLDTDEREYVSLSVAPLGEESSIDVAVPANSMLYFIVAATPSAPANPWEFHLYDYKILRN